MKKFSAMFNVESIGSRIPEGDALQKHYPFAGTNTEYVQTLLDIALKTARESFVVNNQVRSDRVMYVMRYIKTNLLYSIPKEERTSSENKFIEKNKALLNLNTYDHVLMNIQFIKEMEHFFGLGIEAINNAELLDKHPREYIREFKRAEKEWQATADRYIQVSGVPMMELSSGRILYNLNTYYSEAEGNAMGHCGNSPGNPGQIMLSLREKHKSNPNLVKPVVTLIAEEFDKDDDGSLHAITTGEIKGRNNEKPSDKYHQDMAEILSTGIIEHLGGGGYLAENNFELSDLPKSVQEDLYANQKWLFNTLDLYKMDKRTLTTRVKEHLANNHSEFNPEFNTITFSQGPIEDVAREFGLNELQRAAELSHFYDDYKTTGNIPVAQLDHIITDEQIDAVWEALTPLTRQNILFMVNERLSQLGDTSPCTQNTDEILTFIVEHQCDVYKVFEEVIVSTYLEEVAGEAKRLVNDWVKKGDNVFDADEMHMEYDPVGKDVYLSVDANMAIDVFEEMKNESSEYGYDLVSDFYNFVVFEGQVMLEDAEFFDDVSIPSESIAKMTRKFEEDGEFGKGLQSDKYSISSPYMMPLAYFDEDNSPSI